MELKRELQGREPPNHCDHCDPAVCYRAYGVRQLPLCSINLAAERRHRHRQCRGPAPILCGSNPETHSTHTYTPLPSLPAACRPALVSERAEVLVLVLLVCSVRVNVGDAQETRPQERWRPAAATGTAAHHLDLRVSAQHLQWRRVTTVFLGPPVPAADSAIRRGRPSRRRGGCAFTLRSPSILTASLLGAAFGVWHSG
jgi:hypothetical protein